MTYGVEQAEERRGYRVALVCLLASIPLCLGTILLVIHVRRPSFSLKDANTDLPPPGDNTKGHGVYDQVAISSEHPKCSQAGLRMIDLGGNAVDAAIAVLLCVGVVNNFSSGIGGGGFMLIKDLNHTNTTENDSKNEQELVIDFRETAPMASTPDMFAGRPHDSTEGGKSVAVPGELRGMELARLKFPSPLPWRELFQPAIELAENGFPVTKRLNYLTNKYQDVINRHETMKRLYMDELGMPLPVGHVIKRANLARTLRIIGEKGADAFYTGEIAEDTIAMIRDNGGIMTLDDIRNYKAKERKPVKSSYRGFEVTTVGPPASGSVVSYILNICERFDLKSALNSLDLHRIIEAGKYGFAARMTLGDPDFVQVEDRVKWMLEKATAERKNITENAQPVSHYLEGVEEEIKGHGTTQVSIIDLKGGLAVSVTSTVNQAFGSMLMSDRTGILLNDHMDDFSSSRGKNHFGLPPTTNNRIQSGKRPLSSASPVILTTNEGKVFLVTGAAGGSKIITSTVRSIIDVVDFALTPDASVNQPRMHHQLLPNFLMMEDGNDARMIEEMGKRGHKVKVMDPGRFYAAVSMVQCRRDDGRLYAAADPRKGGDVSGH